MQEKTLTNYSWLDIIEPALTVQSMGFVDYVALIISLLFILYLISRFTNIIKKIKFLKISYHLKNSSYSRKYIKQLLELFSFEKDKSRLDMECKKQRKVLLSAYYAKNSVDPKVLDKTLDNLWKSI